MGSPCPACGGVLRSCGCCEGCGRSDDLDKWRSMAMSAVGANEALRAERTALREEVGALRRRSRGLLARIVEWRW